MIPVHPRVLLKQSSNRSSVIVGIVWHYFYNNFFTPSYCRDCHEISSHTMSFTMSKQGLKKLEFQLVLWVSNSQILLTWVRIFRG